MKKDPQGSSSPYIDEVMEIISSIKQEKRYLDRCEDDHLTSIQIQVYDRSCSIVAFWSSLACMAGSKIAVEIGRPFMLTATLMADINKSQAS